MAYVALISLQQSLNQIMLQYSVVQDQRVLIQSLLPKIEYLLEFLEGSSHKSDEKTCWWLTRIRDAAYEAQNIVDLYCYDTEMAIIRHVPKPKNMDLRNIIREMDAIASDIIREQTGSKTEEEKNIESRLVQNDLQLQNSFRAGSPRLASEDIMVGFEYHFQEIMEELTDQQSELEFVSITGMGGSGKTTLAKNIYNHPFIRYHFEIRAWVVASQSIRNILLNILDSMNRLSDEMHGQDENNLKELVFLTLKQRRYLIIIDDIWDTSVWDEMRMVLPNNKYGSRVLLTTRLADVAAYVSSSGHIHHLSPLSSEESWILLGAKVFGNENCPPELQQIGQKISERCGGLPLSLVVMGGLLSRIDKTKEAWLNFEKNVFSDDLDPCLKILKLSYDHLPQQLKPCLLYMAHFQEEEEISVSKLIKLWVAEGFLKQVQHQDPEAVAEKCLMELVDRSMILVSKHNSEGKIKTCRIHGLLLDFCIREANKEKFMCVMTPMYADTFQKTSHNHLRLSIHSKTPDLILSDAIPSFSYVRSLLYTGSGILSSNVFLKFKLLRVLDAIKVAFPNFPSELLNLRYISFTCLEHIPASISNLRNLQTLIIRLEHSLNLPVEIWNMTHLRHVEFIEDSLLYPSVTQLGVDGSSLVLTNLRTLSGVRNLRFTEDVLARIPSIERLKISYDTLDEQEGWSYYEFQNLVNLQLLRQLKIYVVCDLDTLGRWNLTGSKFEFQFPPSLKELTLGGCSISWEDLSAVGCLPNLEVLKLRYRSCVGEHWRPNKGEFCRLKLLLLQSLNLVRWEIDPSDIPFPCLEQLILRDCYALEEIPYEMEEISTLNKIELDKYNESVLASAQKIQELRFDLGNEDFQLVLRTASESSSSNSLIHPEDFETKQPTTPSLGQRGSLAVDSSRFAWDHGIKDWLLGSNYHLEVMSIAGMAGIGKTTLARYLFEYPAIVHFYEVHAWVSVSRTNDVQKIIKGILESVRPIEDEVDDMSLAQLTDTLYKRLKGKRYLIVLDDVWDIQVWDDIKRSFPDDNKWSRIILTTRLLEMDLKARFFKIHHMRLLTPRMSWTLFCMKVFGKEECPQELEYAAKRIVGSCRGLPLAIVVIGGLLSKISRTQNKWEIFAGSMKSAISSKEQLKHILSLSYAYLPPHLKECMLFMIILGEDNYELSVPQIIRGLIAEGLAVQLDSKSSEDVAKELLKDLIDRSLVMVGKQNKKGEVETCDIHSIWQDYFMARIPHILQILLSMSKQTIKPQEGMADLPRSSGEGVYMTIEDVQKGQTNREENLEISMDILFNNRYTKDYIRYCTLFPASYEFTKDIVVWLWIAQGGTIAGSGEFIEEVCAQCFDILLKLKYIVPTGYDPHGDQMKYKVGDEMNGFLQNHLIGSRFSKELDSKHIEESKLEHLSFKEIDQINFEIIKRLSHLQTLVIHGCYGFNIKQLPFDLFLELKELRILSFSHTDVMELPSSIKNSKALRFLDMSETPIRWLPESMCNLSNLQTLKLDNCLGLIRLPKRTKELINLRHLILDVARQLQSMPECIGNLSELRTLRTFLVGEDDGYNINELKNMNKLSGSLRILKLENVKTPDQAADASLGSKHYLKKIELQWSDFQDKENPIEEDILACLEPTFRIQELKIFYYSGGKFPSWISKSSFSELVSITLNKCRYCSILPSLGQLPSLKFLSIIGMNELLEINNLFYGEQVKDQHSFPMLEKLSFDSMFKLERWTEIRIGDFPHLVNLIIESCPEINCLPRLSHLNSLMHMEISYCPELSCLPDGILPSTLESLMIKDCPKLKERCSSDQGEDWPKIAHVPVFYIDSMKIHTK